MCAGPLGGGAKSSLKVDGKDTSAEELRAKIQALGGDPTGMNVFALGNEYTRLTKIKDSGGSALPFTPPAPNPAPTMGLRLPRTPVGVSALKIPRR